MGIDKLKMKLKFSKSEIENDFFSNSNILNPFNDVIEKDFNSFYSKTKRFDNNDKDLFELFETKSISIVRDKKYYRNKDYEFVYKVLFKDGIEFGYLSWKTWRPLNKELLCFDIERKQLYNRNILVSMLNTFFSEFGLEKSNTEIIEIFLDVNKNIEKTYKRYLKNPNRYYFKKCNRKSFHNLNMSLDNRSDTDCFEIGKGIYLSNNDTLYNKGGKKVKPIEVMRIYNKTMELENKPVEYIEYFYMENGISVEQDVYRLEFSVLGKSLYKNNIDIDLNRLNDINYLKGIFDIYYEKFLDIRIRDNNRVIRFTRVKKLYY